MGIAEIGDLLGNGKGIIKIRHMFSRNQNGQNLRHGSRADPIISPFLRYNSIVIEIY